MSQQNFDAASTSESVNNLNNILSSLDDIFTQIYKQTEGLKDYWVSRTASDVFEDFQKLYEKMNNIKKDFETDIKFLNRNVISTYANADAGLIRQVEDKIEM